MTYTLRYVSSSGAVSAMLPDWESLELTSQFSDVGAVKFDYAINGVGAGLLLDQAEVAVFDDDGEVPDSRMIIEGSNGSRVASEGVVFRSYTGRTLWKVFDDSIVYSADYPNVGDGRRTFSAATAGNILSNLISKARGLGELPGITFNFNSDTDSGGNAWGFRLSVGYDMGISLLQVIQNLVDQGIIEARMVGRELQVFTAGRLGTDRTTGSTPLVFWSSQNASEAPEQTDSRGLRTVALVKGDDNKWVEIKDDTAVAKYGRRTAFVSQGGVADSGTLRVLGQATLDRVKQTRSERTYQYAAGPGQPIPFRSYIAGDYVFCDMTGAPERVRVRQIVTKVEASDVLPVVTLTLNDKFMELEIALNRKVEGITGGATAGGGSSALPTDNTVSRDTIAPAKVAGVVASSVAYVLRDGTVRAQVTAGWTEVTTNQDGSTITDLDHYEARYSYIGTGANGTFDDSAARAAMQQQGIPYLTHPNPSATPIQKIRYSVSDWYAKTTGVPNDSTQMGRVVDNWMDRHANIRSYGTGIVDSTTTTWSPVEPGRLIEIKVRAVDQNGNRGQWSDPFELFTGSDTTPPPKPSTPVVTEFLGSVLAYWDGRGSAGEGMPGDFDRIDVHVSKTSGFLPSDATLTGSVRVRGPIAIDTKDYGVTSYVRFVAVDRSDNRSEPSAQAGAAPQRVVADDITDDIITAEKIANGAIGEDEIGPGAVTRTRIADAAIGTAKIADAAIVAVKIGDAAVINAKIADLAVNNAKIADLSVGKLTAGTLSAQIVLGAKIVTGTTGARVEVTGAGIMAYNSKNELTTQLKASDGEIRTTGELYTAAPGGTDPYVRVAPSLYADPGYTGKQPTIEFNLAPATPDGHPRIYANVGAASWRNTLWISSHQDVWNTSGVTRMLLHPDKMEWGAYNGPAESGANFRFYWERAEGTLRLLMSSITRFTFQQGGDLFMSGGKIVGSRKHSGGSGAGAGMLNSGYDNNDIWFSWQGNIFHIWVDNTRVIGINRTTGAIIT